MKFIKFTFLLFILNSNVFANEILQINKGVVEAPSQLESDQKIALQQILGQVVFKLTQQPISEDTKKKAVSLVSKYHYQTENDKTVLYADFNLDEVIKVLRLEKKSIWGDIRPSTVVWAASVTNPTVISSSLDQKITDTVADSSNKYGINLFLPLMDLDDVSNMTVVDINGNFSDSLASASMRYNADYYAIMNIKDNTIADAVLPAPITHDHSGALASADASTGAANATLSKPVIKTVKSIKTKNTGFSFTYSLYQRDDPATPVYSLTGDEESQDAIFTKVINETAKYYFSVFAAKQTILAEYNIKFINISNIQDIAKIEKYLNGLSIIKNAMIQNISGTSVEFLVNSYGSIDDLNRSLVISPNIRIIDSFEAGVPSSYEWR